MKKILPILTALLFYCAATAQDEVNTSFADQMNTVFGSLDLSKVPHGILLDYGMEFTNVPAYNGTITDSTYSDKTTLQQIYNTLISSRVQASTTVWLTPAQYADQWNTQKASGVVTISGLFFMYAQFSATAVTAGKLTVTNNKFYDKTTNGVWQNPYQEFKTFAMAPALRQSDQKVLQVRIPSGIFLSNSASSVASIQIDFNNGSGYVTIPFNQNVNVSYTTEGTKTWKYKLNLTDGTSLYNQSLIKIGRDQSFGEVIWPPPKPVCELCRVVPSESPISITATIPYLGKSGSAKITIDYAGDPSQGIKRPLIIAEGFDLGVLLEPEKQYGNYSYGDFMTSVLASNSTELRRLIYNGNKQYDIIYVDWDNGVDYLQRNAYALEQVINYVNTVKTSNAKNVVLGQSMGGVIARYALADMEQRGIDHQTSLFISHDAPQQGANIPVSLQFMFRHITKQFVQVGNTTWGNVVTIPLADNKYNVTNSLSILDAPASKQLIANFVNSGYGIDNTAHIDFYNELKAKGLANSGGYPMQCRNIAISNGSECGTPQNFNPGDDLVNVNYNKSLNFLEDLASLIVNPLGGSLAGEFVNRNFYGVAILGLHPGHSTYNVNFQAKSLYASGGNQIYKGRISYTKKIFWLIKITIDLTNVGKNQPSNMLPFDTFGGGYYNAEDLIAPSTTPGLTVMIKDHFNFIPTVSALDIGKRNVTLSAADYLSSYIGAVPPVAPKNSPFTNFTADINESDRTAHNKAHISFDKRNGDWLSSELDALINPSLLPLRSNCSFICADAQITGENSFCSTAVYSVPHSAQSYNWSVTQGASLVALTGNGTNTVTLRLLAPKASQQIVLSLTVASPNCGSRTLTKTITVGNIPPTSSIEGPYEICENQTITYTVPGTCPDVPAIEWSVTPNLTILSVSGYSVTVRENTGTAGSAKLTATFPSDGSTMTRNMEIGDDKPFIANKTVFQYPTDVYNNFQHNGKLIFNMEVFPKNPDSEYTFTNFKVNGIPVTIGTQRRTSSTYTFWVPMYLADEVNCPMLEYTLTCTSRCNVSRSVQSKVPISCAGFFDPGPLEPLDPFEPLQNRTSNEKPSYKIYPNPSSQTLNISLADESYRPVASSTISAELYTITGDLKSTVTIKNHTAQLDISILPLGVYVLRINIDGRIESHQVLIQ
jgi:hypothetical protein